MFLVYLRQITEVRFRLSFIELRSKGPNLRSDFVFFVNPIAFGSFLLERTARGALRAS